MCLLSNRIHVINMLVRCRRNRWSEGIRALVRENRVTVDDLVMPLFVNNAPGVSREPIASLPGLFRLSIEALLLECKELMDLGIKAVALFPAIDAALKDPRASDSKNPDGLTFRAISALKKAFPSLIVVADVAMDPYSSDGHDGLVDAATGIVLNDDSLPILCEMAVCHARAGADIVAPSDMMDGRIGAIRHALDNEGFQHVGILSYAAKYASSFYGPFRDALDSAPKKGDKKTYQMDPANSQEALREVALDIAEGADIVMVKPGLAFLDIIRLVSENFNVPVAAYNVSGEYAMLRAASERGWLNYKNCVIETLTGFKRAGASIIFTYHAKEFAQWLKSPE